jgi:hypothetical protein
LFNFASEAMDLSVQRGDLSCEEDQRSGRLFLDLSERIRRRLDKFPFTSARVLAKHFRTSLPAMRRTLKTHLRLQKFSRRWVSHDLTDDQKRLKCEISNNLLIALRNDEPPSFSHVVTGDESWFSYCYEAMHCYAKSHEEVLSRTKITIATERAMVTLFFTGTKLLVLYIRPGKEKFNQDLFLPLLH